MRRHVLGATFQRGKYEVPGKPFEHDCVIRSTFCDSHTSLHQDNTIFFLPHNLAVVEYPFSLLLEVLLVAMASKVCITVVE
jgi:hypothetical protein